MALDAKAVLKQLDSLREYLAVEASKELDAAPEPEAAESPMESHEAAEAMKGGEGPGMGVVIAMKPKPSPGGKVDGCPDCADGTPHEHVGK